MSLFFLHLFINTLALWAAAKLVPGIGYTGPWYGMLAVALVFGILNAFVRPILKILSFPLIILTLGLFTFVLNAFMLWLTSAASKALEIGFIVAGFWPALLGAFIISIINMVLFCMISPE